VKGGVSVLHAFEEGNADVLIVNEALNLANDLQNVEVVADDTDILVLLTYHAKKKVTLGVLP